MFFQKAAASAACFGVLFAAATGVTAQEPSDLTSVGVRFENDETWAYIDLNDGGEIIAAPYRTLTEGFVSVGGELAPEGGQAPRLDGYGSATPGSSNELRLSGAQPGADAVLVVGFLDVGDPLLGGELVPSPDFVIDGLVTNDEGGLVYRLILPPDFPVGGELFAQFWTQDAAAPEGYSATNGVRMDSDLVGQTLEDMERVRLLGLSLDKLDALTDDEADLLIDVLNGASASAAAYLWDTTIPGMTGDPILLKILSRLSQHIMLIVEKALILEPYATWVANGCTQSPDFNFKHCCDKHDACYCMGGNEAARLKCDKALRDCIKKAGHRILAQIYYKAVRAAGKKHFNYC